MPDHPLLELQDLRREFVVRSSGRGAGRRVVRAVDGVSLSVPRGGTLAIVGESGSGKTTLARMIVGLTIPTSGSVAFDGAAVDWSSRGSRALRAQIQMVFQDPMGSLDPRWQVRDLIAEPLRNFESLDEQEYTRRVDEVLDEVGLDATQGRKRPRELSGGQRQRVGIARAIVIRPQLVVCDEPVSALDVSVRGQVLELLSRLRGELGLTYVVISHDISIVKKLASEVATMYLGQIVERAPTARFFDHPLHPYAQALISAVPVPDPTVESTRRRVVLHGEVGDASRIPAGCRFHPRCPLATERCVNEVPAVREVEPGRLVRCHYAPDARIGAREPVTAPPIVGAA